MIKVTKLNGKSFRINAVYIEAIESFPDTTISLTNGKKFVVRESEEQVSELIRAFYQSVGLFGRRILEEHDDEK